jgi:hypothetical protein
MDRGPTEDHTVAADEARPHKGTTGRTAAEEGPGTVHLLCQTALAGRPAGTSTSTATLFVSRD